MREWGRRLALALGPWLVLGALCWLFPALWVGLRDGTQLLVRGDLEGLRAWGARLGPWAALGTTALMIVQALAAPIPAVLVTATNSWLFGPWLGALLSIGAATLAAVICYGLARLLGEPAVARLVGGHVSQRMQTWLESHGVVAILVARLLPFVPFDPISYAAGLGKMRLAPFCAATFVGQIPAGVAYSLLAQQVDQPKTLLVALPGVMLALLVVGFAARRALHVAPAPEATEEDGP